ncbi:MAG: hypothetical protein KGM18_07670 [Sphingomonadales bacterium]|nr:hypothetical protein [Sphingomonadales bacterium]
MMLPPDALAKSGRPRVKRAGITLAVLTLLACLPATALAQGEIQADIILRNGAVATMDPAHPSAQAIAIKGKQILAVGTDAEVAARRDRQRA